MILPGDDDELVRVKDGEPALLACCSFVIGLAVALLACALMTRLIYGGLGHG